MPASAASAAPLRVVTLSTVLTEFARRLSGGQIAVNGLIPPGVDPHTFEPSPPDVAAIGAADLVLVAGLDLDDRFRRVAAHAGGPSLVRNLWPDEADPHWWNSVVETKKVLARLQGALCERAPDIAPDLMARARVLNAELDDLDRWVRSRVGELPAARRIIVTTHDAFGWFARDYGFEVRSLTGFNPAAEPSARDLARIEDTVKAAGVRSVFLESGANPQLPRVLAEDTGARLGGELYADGLSPAGDGATYAGMIRHNVQTLVDGLK